MRSNKLKGLIAAVLCTVSLVTMVGYSSNSSGKGLTFTAGTYTGVGDGRNGKIKVVKGQTLAVDAVAGATMTGDGILKAVEDCVKQAGGAYGKSYVDFQGGTLGFAYTSGKIDGENAASFSRKYIF